MRSFITCTLHQMLLGLGQVRLGCVKLRYVTLRYFRLVLHNEELYKLYTSPNVIRVRSVSVRLG
jgi:hypothetical protein